MGMTSPPRPCVLPTPENSLNGAARGTPQPGYLLARFLITPLTISALLGFGDISAIASLSDGKTTASPENPRSVGRTGREAAPQVASRSSTLGPSTVTKPTAGVSLS